MKVYQCDACKRTIKDPYQVKMKEFYVGCRFDLFGVFPEDCKRRVKIHICDSCYRGLHLIAEKQRSDNNGK